MPSRKENWDIIREILLELDELHSSSKESIKYLLKSENPKKSCHAFILQRRGLVCGLQDLSSTDECLIAHGLTREGQEVLGSIRSMPVWEGIKTIAHEERIKLTVDSIRTLSTLSLRRVFPSATQSSLKG